MLSETTTSTGSEGPTSLIGPETLRAMCVKAGQCPPGAFVEVGVYQGGSAWHLARVARSQGRPLFLYDTFSGIPFQHEQLDRHEVGDFGDTDMESVHAAIPDATIVQGIFPDSAIEMGPIAFVHLDCDQYKSYKDSLEYLVPRMVPSGVIWCDDVDCLPGAGEAMYGFAQQHGIQVFKDQKPYLQF
jgi:predicted O-methyltransferase YrrM